MLTKEHRRFAEFCDACRRYGYIGICYGPPGVGKTLSARYYANCSRLEAYRSSQAMNEAAFAAIVGSDTVFYTPKVVNSPGRMEEEIRLLRNQLRSLAWEKLYREQEAQDLLAPVYGWFTEGFDTADLQEAKALLDALA